MRNKTLAYFYHHKVYPEEVNKIALSSDDEKRLQTFDRVTT